MKRDQKSNNKGFSLVELIVVIAIMAVLMGVLAPTLIGNVEKSRESTDLQNLDTIQGAVTTAMNQENVSKLHGGNAKVVTMSTDGNNTLSGADADAAFVAALQAELNESLTTKITTKSGAAGKDGNSLQITISAGGAVEVAIVNGGTVVRCEKTKDETGAKKELKSGNATAGTTAASGK